jgi:cysteine-rich repeat protein
MVRSIRVALALGLLAVVAHEPLAVAAKNPSVRCRSSIGKGVVSAVTSGLKIMGRCHKARLKSGSSANCNSLAGADFQRAKARAVARVKVACKENDPVGANYNQGTVSLGFPTYLDAIQKALEEGGAELLGSTLFTGDKQTIKPLQKCHGAVGLGQTLVVTGALKSAVKCQAKIDKKATSFGPIDQRCLTGSGSASGKASAKIGKSCGSLSGATVGSCPALPGCLLSAAEDTGRVVSRLTYGGPATCGDGIKDPQEICDDGNTVNEDECTNGCELPVCGDQIVSTGEECDEPNDGVGDNPDQNCYKCKLNVCGDGNLDLQEPGIEQCDDGNDVASDGCTSCTLDPKVCDANGLTVEMTLAFPEDFLAGVAAAELLMSYPPPLSIPGSGNGASVRERVTSLLPDGYSFARSDRDTDGNTVDDQVSAIGTAPPLGNPIEPGKFAKVQFDCPAGTEVHPTDFPCTVAQLIDPGTGAPFAPELFARARCVVELGGVAQTTTTTSTTVAPIPTTTSTLPPLCGNDQTDAGEECDDGNQNPDDGCTNFCTICGNNVVTAPESCDSTEVGPGLPCPADCRIEPCQPTAGEAQSVTITASRADLDSIRFILDYPDGRVALGGGAGPDVPPGTFSDSAADITPFDLEHGITVVVSGGFPFETATITKVHLLGCTGAPLPAASDYKCTVTDASVDLQAVTGVTCSVSIP